MISFTQYIESTHDHIDAEYRKQEVRKMAARMVEKHRLAKKIYDEYKTVVSRPKTRQGSDFLWTANANRAAYDKAADAFLDLAEKDQQLAQELAVFGRSAIKRHIADIVENNDR